MSEWQRTTLGDCADWLSGGTPFKGNPAFWSGTIPWVSAKDMKSFRLHDAEDHISADAVGRGGKLVPSGTVLLLVRGMTLHNDVPICVTMREMAFNQDIKAIRAKPGLEHQFLAYWLLANKPALLSAVDHAGHGTGRLMTDLLKQMSVELPPLPEQRAIAAVLGALDDKIELNRRMNETLEALAQSLFKSWFVDAAQSALPKGWRYATIAELCEINSWTLGKADELDQIEYVEISEVMRGNIANIQSYERGEEPSRARRRLRHGATVLSTVRPDRGAYFLCLNPSPNLIGSTGFAVLTPTKAPWSFIHAAMTQPDVSEYLGQQADGGAYPAVRPEIIGALEVPWPDKPELVEEFHRACAPLYERAELNRQESRTLAALRDALLPKLLSGELRVPAAAGNMEARA